MPNIPQLPNEIILHILKHRRNLSWYQYKQKIHDQLQKCFVTTTNSIQTNFDFRGHWVTYFQGPDIEIFISQRPNWVVISYILLVSKPHPKKTNVKIKKIIYCPIHHIN